MFSLVPRTARIVDVYDDGADARHFTLECDEASPPAEPGQFFMLTVPGFGEAPFTYVSLPDGSRRFSALIRRVGSLTRALFELPLGALVGVRGPFGRPWPMEALVDRHVLVLAGGCGLAPLAAAVDRLLGGGSTRLDLVFGARSPEAQILARERARWRSAVPFVEVFDVPAPGVTRVGTPIDAMDELLRGATPDAVLTCGPEPMMEAVARAFTERGFPAERLWISIERRMHCGVGHCGHCYVGASYACRDGPTYRWDELCALREGKTRRALPPDEPRYC